MTDIVEALRSGEDGYELAAADEIERLRADYREYRNCSDRIDRKHLKRIAQLEAGIDAIISGCAGHDHPITQGIVQQLQALKEQSDV